jgi:Helicase associated domain
MPSSNLVESDETRTQFQRSPTELKEQLLNMKFKASCVSQSRIPLKVLASSNSEIAGFDVLSGSDACPDREHSPFNDSDLTDESCSLDDHSEKHGPNRPVELLQGKDADMVSCVAAILHLSSSSTSSGNNNTSELEVEKHSQSTNDASVGREISTRRANNQVTWERSFERLKQFQLQHGHCRVPPKRDKALSVWANNQRYQLHANRRFKYKQDRIALLDSIGFNWGCVHPRASNQVSPSNIEIANDQHVAEETQLKGEISDNGTINQVELQHQGAKEIECATAILALSNTALQSPLKVQGDARNILFKEENNGQRQLAFDREQQQRQVQQVHCFVPGPQDQGQHNWFTNYRPQRFGYPRYVQERIHFYWGNRNPYTGAPYATTTISSTEETIVSGDFTGNNRAATPENAIPTNAHNSSSTLNDIPRLSELSQNNAIGSEHRSGESDTQSRLPVDSESRDNETSNQHEVNWRKSFERLKEFQIRTGHCQVPKNHDKTLYTWATNQRQLRNKGPRYKQERIDLLDSIGFNWGTSKIQSNNVPPATSTPPKVSNTCLDQSELVHSEEQLEPEDTHMINIETRESGRATGCQDSEAVDTVPPPIPFNSRGSLCSNTNENCGEHLPHKDDPVAVTSRLSTSTNNSPDDPATNGGQKLKWQKNFDCLKRYKEEHGHCQVLRKHDKTLHSWVQNQRTSLGRHASGYKQERVDALNSIGFIWSKKRYAKGAHSPASPSNELSINQGMPQELEDATWKLMFERLKEFKATNGHFRVPLQPHGELRSWILTQLSQLRDCQGFKRERVDFLNSIGFPWGHGHPLANDSSEHGCNHGDLENKPWIGNCWDHTNDHNDIFTDARSKQPTCIESTRLNLSHPNKRMKIA